jgi:addiction module RelE/StbE family toxin
MRLRWSPEAANDLEKILRYLEENRPRAAQPTVRRLYEAIRRLRKSPRMGRIGHIPGIRELILSGLPYIVLFRPTAELVEIVRIYHSAQNWRQ